MAEAAPQYEEAEPLPNPSLDEIDEIEIEVLDDTPEEDQRPNRAEMGDHQSADEGEELDREIADYSIAAQDRIKKLKYDFHEELKVMESLKWLVKNIKKPMRLAIRTSYLLHKKKYLH